jgi:hypothetical protein
VIGGEFTQEYPELTKLLYAAFFAEGGGGLSTIDPPTFDDQLPPLPPSLDRRRP